MNEYIKGKKLFVRILSLRKNGYIIGSQFALDGEIYFTVQCNNSFENVKQDDLVLIASRPYKKLK